MNGKLTTLAILVLTITALNCAARGFKTNTENSRDNFIEKRNGEEKTNHDLVSQSGNANQNAPRKLAEFTYRKMKHAVYLVADLGEDEENVEFIKIAQKLHDTEPDTALILIDNDSGLKHYLAFMKTVEKINGGAPDQIEFPKKWAEEHILGNVGAEDENQSRKWFLRLGYAREKIAELK